MDIIRQPIANENDDCLKGVPAKNIDSRRGFFCVAVTCRKRGGRGGDPGHSPDLFIGVSIQLKI